MDRVTTDRRRRVLAVVLPAALLVPAACGDGDEVTDRPPVPRAEAPSGDPHGTTPPLDPGDLAIETPDGFTPVPLVSLGIGFALPEDWQAVVLTDEAIERIEELGFVAGFADAARAAQRSGAVLYAAAGPGGDDGFADLELRRIPEPGDRPAADALAQAAASAVAAAPGGAELDEQPDADPPRARIRFEVPDDGLDATGTQWLVTGPTAVWSLVLTSDDADRHDALAEAVVGTVTFPAG
jgi:hypothetical protein